jgi:hypothetical protein
MYQARDAPARRTGSDVDQRGHLVPGFFHFLRPLFNRPSATEAAAPLAQSVTGGIRTRPPPHKEGLSACALAVDKRFMLATRAWWRKRSAPYKDVRGVLALLWGVD